MIVGFHLLPILNTDVDCGLRRKLHHLSDVYPGTGKLLRVMVLRCAHQYRELTVDQLLHPLPHVFIQLGSSDPNLKSHNQFQHALQSECRTYSTFGSLPAQIRCAAAKALLLGQPLAVGVPKSSPAHHCSPSSPTETHLVAQSRELLPRSFRI